jgi:hypothetical protein
MSKRKGRALPLAVLVSCALLAACEEAPPDEGAQAAAQSKPKAAKEAALEERMVAAVASGKSAASIGLHFALTKAPTVNEGLPVDIALVPHQDFTSVAVHFFSQDGLTLVSGDTLGPVSEVDPGKPIRHQVVLMPARDGVYMVNASVETIGSDGTVSRIFSIPVVVAPPTAAPEPVAPAPPAQDPAQPAVGS